MYQTIGMTLTTEEDVFEEGLTSGTYDSVNIEYNFKHETLVGLYEILKDFLGVEDDAMYIDDTYGHLCATFMTNERKEKASITEILEWKKGKKRLWSATYRFRVIETHNVDLEQTELDDLVKG